MDDQYGSDHFPLLLTSNDSIPTEDRFYFKFSKADWEKFSQLCSEDLTEENFYFESHDTADGFASILYMIARDCIPTTKVSEKCKIKKPWFTDEF